VREQINRSIDNDTVVCLLLQRWLVLPAPRPGAARSGTCTSLVSFSSVRVIVWYWRSPEAGVGHACDEQCEWLCKGLDRVRGGSESHPAQLEHSIVCACPPLCSLQVLRCRAAVRTRSIARPRGYCLHQLQSTGSHQPLH
jgi:hypothetical protein